MSNQRDAFPWTDELDQMLRERYSLTGPHRLSAETGIPVACLKRRARMLGLSCAGRKGPRAAPAPYLRWTREMVDVLLRHYPSEGSVAVGERLGIPESCVRRKASRLGVARAADINEDYFDTWTPNMAYSLGWIWADGSIDKPLWTLILNCHSKDEAVILAMREDMKSGHTIHRRPANQEGGRNNGPRTTLSIGSSKLVACLHDRHGLRPGKTYLDLPFPEVPDEYLPHFVRGYIDGDGCVNYYAKNGTLTVNMVGTRQFLAGMQDRICSALPVGRNKISVQGSICSIQWARREDVRLLANWLYPPGDYIFLARKRDKMAMVHSMPVCTAKRRQK